MAEIIKKNFVKTESGALVPFKSITHITTSKKAEGFHFSEPISDDAIVAYMEWLEMEEKSN